MRQRHCVRPALALLTILISGLLGVGCSSSRPPTVQGPAPRASVVSSEPAVPCPAPQPSTPQHITLGGLAYSPYHTGQNPNVGLFPSSQEVAADLPTLAALTPYIRVYSSRGPADAILEAAAEHQMCVNLGVWIGKDAQANDREIDAARQLVTNPQVQSLTVGNEVLMREDMPESELRAVIQRVRAAVGDSVPITMADDYRHWLEHPGLAQDVDFITVHIYPFWERVPIESALSALENAYLQVQKAFPTKQIVIGEVGWPSAGPAHGDAVPSAANQARYLQEFVEWAERQRVQYFYFDAFDEGWKVHEYGVGTHWGLYQEDGTLKPELGGVLPAADPRTTRERSFRDVFVGGLEQGFGLGVDTSGGRYDWVEADTDGLVLTYPDGQDWGTVFITAGQPAPVGERQSVDLSGHRSIEADMRAATGNQCVRVGVKDVTQADDGSEVTIPACLTTRWETVRFALERFEGADKAQLYVVFEVVFDGGTGATIEVNNIRYSPDAVN